MQATEQIVGSSFSLYTSFQQIVFGEFHRFLVFPEFSVEQGKIAVQLKNTHCRNLIVALRKLSNLTSQVYDTPHTYKSIALRKLGVCTISPKNFF